MVNITRVEFHGWPTCYQVANPTISLIATADIGPRIVSLSLTDGPNELLVIEDDTGCTGGDHYRFYGGHRLWHAPEVMPRTYSPDNQPVKVDEIEKGLRLTAPIEASTGIQKQIEITMAEREPSLRIVHRLTNLGLWTVELAPWAITMCSVGGVGIVPLPEGGDHTANLLPRTSLTLWAYTNLADPRWVLGEHCVLLRQDAQLSSPQKTGLYVEQGWIAYANHGHLLVKTFDAAPEATYEDRGCNAEMFTNDRFLEIETLGPVCKLEPNQTVEHVENWHLLDNVPEIKNEADVIQYVLPRVAAIL
ncbi:MAG: hypothetical protein JXB07_18730 [Anaerolineae bacterium]|nr:hypothetical protein [Anaerolineae bacterium]